MNEDAEIRAIVAEARSLAHDGPVSWALCPGPDGHWTNTFMVHGPEGEWLAECEYRPTAELLVAAHNELPDLLAEVSRLRRAIEHHRHAIEQPGLYPQYSTDDEVSERLWSVLDE